jgi:transposase
VSCERRVPAEHPLRAILPITDAALAALSGDFEQLYAVNGRPSIAPEKLLRALLLQAFYSVRSERQLMEQLDYNLLFRWFVGLGVDDPVWAVTVFTKNRDRLLEGAIAAKFLRAVLAPPKVKALLSDEHFSIDGTLIQAWASMKSFRPKDGSGEPPAPGRNGERNFHGEQRTNDSHASTTDPCGFRRDRFTFRPRRTPLARAWSTPRLRPARVGANALAPASRRASERSGTIDGCADKVGLDQAL